MNESRPPKGPNPERIFQTFIAYQRSAALKAAVDLDLFTAIGTGRHTASEIAQKCGASQRGVRILLDYLVIDEFLIKEEERYGQTPESAAFLDRSSPTCLGSIANFLNSAYLMDHFRELTRSVQSGGREKGRTDGSLTPEHPMWVEFARSMAPMMAGAAQEMAQLLGAEEGPSWKVLDIAAGHGIFGITLARLNPNAEVVGLDWANVLQVAVDNASQAGLSDRYRTIAGSAFTVDYGSGFDIVLLTNFLHHFDSAECDQVLRKVYSALKPGGRAVTLEFVPNEDRVSPPVSAAFSLMMLGTTPAGDAYTFAELDEMMKNVGFQRNELHDLTASPQQLVISYR